MRALITCVALAALALRCVVAELVNAEVEREVDIRSNVEVETTVVTMRNDGALAEASFVLTLPKARGALGTLIVAEGSAIKKDGSGILTMTAMATAIDERKYRVEFTTPLAPGARITVTVLVDYMATLRPLPATIRAGEQQHIAYAGDAYWHSPYTTEKCRTVVALPVAQATSVGELPEPHKTGRYQLVLGPYAFGAAATHAYTLRVLNNRGFLVAKRATLWYHVSHWGRVAVREEFVLRNDAAKLQGEWSRADYDRNAGKVDPTSHGDVWANLPPDATGVVYEDLIGNITTSRLRDATSKQRSIMLTFRYPMLGGWRNHFWYRYTIGLVRHLRTAGTRHVLTLPALPALHYDLPIEEHEVRIALPAGARDIVVDPHPTLRFTVRRESADSTLSVLGRPTVVLSHNNVRSGAPHQGSVTLRYTYAKHMLLLAPAYVVTLLAGLFALALMAARTTVMLGRDEIAEKVAATRKNDLAHLQKVFDDISATYKDMQSRHNRLLIDGDEALIEERPAVQQRLTSLEEKMEEYAEVLDDPKKKTVLDVVRQLRRKRELSMRVVAIESARASKSLRSEQYLTEMKRITPQIIKLSELAVDGMAAVCRSQ